MSIFERIPEEPTIETQFLRLDHINADEWDKLVDAGVPLYTSLQKAGDARAEEVAVRLRRLRATLETTDEGDPSEIAENEGTDR